MRDPWHRTTNSLVTGGQPLRYPWARPLYPWAIDGRPKDQYCKLMGDPWAAHERLTHGQPMGQYTLLKGNPWDIHGSALQIHMWLTGQPWASHGLSIGTSIANSRATHGRPVDDRWATHGPVTYKLMDDPRVTSGRSMKYLVLQT